VNARLSAIITIYTYQNGVKIMCEESKCNCLCGLFGSFSLFKENSIKENSNPRNYEKTTDYVLQHDLRQTIEARYGFTLSKNISNKINYVAGVTTYVPVNQIEDFSKILKDNQIISIPGTQSNNIQPFMLTNKNAEKLLDALKPNNNLGYQIN
jgi:hypothetical protein